VNAPPYRQHYVKDEIVATEMLSPHAYTALGRLRDFSWAHEGIPADEKRFLEVCKHYKISRYMIQKVWPEIKHFFVMIGEKFFHEEDERGRMRIAENTSKLQQSGRLGASIRWSKPIKEAPPSQKWDGGAMQNATQQPIAWPSENDGIPDPEPDTDIKGGAPAAASSSTGNRTRKAAAAGPPIESQSNENANETPLLGLVSEDWYRKLVTRCGELSLPVPSRQLGADLEKIFSPMQPESFVAFGNQDSPGLWLHKTPENMNLERVRQVNTVRKSPQHEREAQDQRLTDRLTKYMAK
jgi:hypothetical protein